MPVEVTAVETPGLGDRSYVATSGEVAVVVDPQRDVDRFLAAADEKGARIACVVETHIHNDYVTGGLELAASSGAAYCVAAAEDVGYSRRAVADGDRIELGPFSLVAMHTPGHTPNHVSYVLEEAGHKVAVFTGGSLLYGTVGRTDLISKEMTAILTRAQWQSARRLAADLPADAEVYPTHGFGSFCASAAGSGASSSTIGQEVGANLALTIEDEDEFVERLVSGLSEYPRYYAHMAPINRAGPPPVQLELPERLDGDELRRRALAGDWVVDLRARRAFAHVHLAGTVSVELSGSFATYLGWTISWGTPLVLLGDSRRQVTDACRELVRIGVDDLAGVAIGSPAELFEDEDLRRYQVATFADLAGLGDGHGHGHGQGYGNDHDHGDGHGPGHPAVLDVRMPDEWRAGHLEAAVHIPFYELEGRIEEVPEADEVWVYCASGFRASMAASLLERAGRTPVLIDDEWQQAAASGLEVVAW